jgi:hypothetical protein
MRRAVCWFKGHDYELVESVDMWVIPTVGPRVVYKPGEARACRRCRRLDPEET